MSNIFPADWTVKPLEKIALQEKGSIVDGPFGSNLKTSDYVASGIPVLQGKNITNDKFKWFDVRYITETKAEELRRSSVRVGDILIVKIGSVGYSAIVDDLQGYEYAIIPANLLKISVNEKAFSTSFLHQYLTSPEGRKRLIDAASTTAQPALSLATVKQFSIPIPPLPEQQKIATILSSVDDVIEKTRAQIDKLKDLKTGMMQELLTKGIGHTEFKDSPVGRIPAVWEIKPLSMIVCQDSPICYGILMPGKHVTGGVPVIKVRDIKNGVVLESNLLLTSNEIDEKYSRSRVRAGDILLTIRGTTGRTAVVQRSLDNANITQDTARVRVKSEQLARYILVYLQSPLGQTQIESHTIGQAVKGINLEEVRKICVVLPPEAERNVIAGTVFRLDQRINCIATKLDSYLNIKKALMQDLLTGKVRVNLTDKESAVV